MKRLNFLNRFSSLLGITVIAPSILASCSTNEPETEATTTIVSDEEEILTEEEIQYNLLKENTAGNGKFLQGRTLYVDVTHENYTSLNTVGEFINDPENYILILRKSEDLFQTFSNCCPHSGTSNRWSYSQGNFRCANHGNSYGTNNANTVRCGSGRTSGNLKQYNTSLNQDILTIDFDS